MHTHTLGASLHGEGTLSHSEPLQHAYLLLRTLSYSVTRLVTVFLFLQFREVTSDPRR